MGRSQPLPAPPPTPTRVRRQGGAYIGPGDVTLAGGVGLALRDGDPGELVFDAPAVDRHAPSGLFIPTLSTFPSSTLRLPSSPTYLTMVEALIAGTAPAAGTDTNNCRAVRVRGSTSGQQDLKLSTVGGRSFNWLGSDVATLGEQTDDSAAPSGERGFATKFRPTAALRVSTVGMELGSTFLVAGKSRVYEILNAARTQVLATTAAITDEGADNTLRSYPLTASVDLQQGVDYFIGVRIVGGASERLQARGSGTTKIWGGSVDTNVAQTVILNRADTGSWTNPSMGIVDDTAGLGVLVFRLSGSPGGVLVTGNLIVEPVAFGAPPNDPTSINLRLQWATEL